MKHILIVIAIIFLLASCKKDEPIEKIEPQITNSTYSILPGTYVSQYYKSWPDGNGGIYELSRYETWTFDNSDIVNITLCSWEHAENGWQNIDKNTTYVSFKWKIEEGVLFMSFWNPPDTNIYWRPCEFEHLTTNSFMYNSKIFTRN